MNTKPKCVYRMCGCSVVQTVPGTFSLWHHAPHDGGSVWLWVADFPSQRAAIRYLAREFVIPKTLRLK